ncbi:hypothetical protein BN903_4 [Halorubrum sp. AJ67]|nr:hypothetical protein BN903_4 [Halorubrum sp. AJ67]
MWGLCRRITAVDTAIRLERLCREASAIILSLPWLGPRVGVTKSLLRLTEIRQSNLLANSSPRLFEQEAEKPG